MIIELFIIFNVSFIKPILKDFKKPNSDIKNLRPISISNSLSQFFERLILEFIPEIKNTHDNQFGYKNKTGCMNALFCLKETITNNIENKKPCYVVSFDAEKAFDKLWRPGLFYKLMVKFDISIVMLLKSYYDVSFGIVKNGLFKSERFKIDCGVKQGGTISGHLYNFYTNDYYVASEERNLGEKFFDLFVGCIGYCDDNVNISSKYIELQQMIDYNGEYTYNWGIKLNDEKCYIVCFGSYNDNNVMFYLNGKPITKKNELNFLGYSFKSNLDDNLNFYNKFQNVRSSFYSLYSYGLKPNCLNPFLQSYLYKMFCISKFLYGTEIMSINKSTISKVNTMQNILIKSMIGISKYCHNSELLRALKLFDIKNLIYFMKLSFIKSIKNNKLSFSILNKLIENNMLYNSNSKSFIKDFKFICCELKVDFNFLVNNIYSISRKFKEDYFQSSSTDDTAYLLILDSLKNYNFSERQYYLNLILKF